MFAISFARCQWSVVRRQLSEAGIVVPDHVLARNAMMSAVVRVFVAHAARVHCLRSVVAGLLTEPHAFDRRSLHLLQVRISHDIVRMAIRETFGRAEVSRSGDRTQHKTHASRVHYKNQNSPAV